MATRSGHRGAPGRGASGAGDGPLRHPRRIAGSSRSHGMGAALARSVRDRPGARPRRGTRRRGGHRAARPRPRLPRRGHAGPHAVRPRARGGTARRRPHHGEHRRGLRHPRRGRSGPVRDTFAAKPDLVVVEAFRADDETVEKLEKRGVPVPATLGADPADPIRTCRTCSARSARPRVAPSGPTWCSRSSTGTSPRPRSG